MKFLVPTDFSDNAFHASMYALTLAQAKPGSTVHLVHVLTPVLYDPLIIGDVEEDTDQFLEKMATELKAKCNNCTTITHSVEIGDTVAEINKISNEQSVGFIIMGIKGLGKTQRFLFGSNTISLTNRSSRPVLVVPETAALVAPRKIVFATDYYDSDTEALQQLIPIATAFNAEIVVVHLFDEREEEQSELIMTNFLSSQLFKDIEYPRISYRVYYNERTAQGIKNFCTSISADLLVLSARKHTIFDDLFRKSVTKELSYNSEIPLVIFHVQKSHSPQPK